MTLPMSNLTTCWKNPKMVSCWEKEIADPSCAALSPFSSLNTNDRVCCDFELLFSIEFYVPIVYRS